MQVTVMTAKISDIGKHIHWSKEKKLKNDPTFNIVHGVYHAELRLRKFCEYYFIVIFIRGKFLYTPTYKHVVFYDIPLRHSTQYPVFY